MPPTCIHKAPVLYISEETAAGRRGEAIVKRYCPFLTAIYYTNYWSPADPQRRAHVRQLIARSRYELIISYKADLILLRHEIERASRGAVNIHPAPPEHPGLGMYVFPALYPEKRCFGGVTVHEITTQIDGGPIYKCVRFPIPSGSTLNAIRDLTSVYAEELLDQTAQELATFHSTKRLLCNSTPIKWGPRYYSHQDEVRMMTIYQHIMGSKQVSKARHSTSVGLILSR